MPFGFKAISCASLGCALSLSACSSRAPTAPPDAPAFVTQGNRILIPSGSPLRSRLVVSSVTDAGIAQPLVAPAVVEADPAGQNRILTPLAGRIVRLGVRLGDRVRAGQILAELASPDVSSALADDARARTQMRLTTSARDRALGVKAIGGASEKDVQQAQADFAAAQAEATRTRARLRQVGASAAVRGGGLVLTAPSSGVVTELAAAPGAYWNDTTAPLMTIANTTTVWVTANVTESDIGAIREGQPVTIALTAYPDAPLAGRVRSIAPMLDPDTRRARVRIAIANPDGRLKPGMFATVGFDTPVKTTPTVPTAALLLKDDATTVLVEVAPWTFERRTVDTGPDQGDSTTITHGLSAGQRIIAKGGVLLDD